MVADHFPAASEVSVGMTLEQALSRQTDGAVLEADEAAYRQEFHRMLLSLQGVSDRVEGAELGTAYVRPDGLEALYGGEVRLVKALPSTVSRDLAPRVVGESPSFRLTWRPGPASPWGQLGFPMTRPVSSLHSRLACCPYPRLSGSNCTA